MGLFERRPKGRHALGAAVTSIPSGAPAVHVPVGTPTAPVVQPVAEPPAAEPPVLTSIAELIATGEAWRSEAEIVADLRAPAVPPVAAAPLLPVLPPPVPSGPRIQLGFRDGTSTTLDAGSEQALALELLAQSLTRRD